jgi:putative phosphoesterase
MKVGIISDTHDNLEAVDAAIEVIESEEVSLTIHTGDVISPFAAERLKDLSSPVKAVFGNNDGERTGLKKKFREFGAEIDDFIEFRHGGKRFAVYHGTIEGVLESLVEAGLHDVVACGHTHRPEIKTIGNTLFINPGEVCGYLTNRRSLCLLDINTMEPEIVNF